MNRSAISLLALTMLLSACAAQSGLEAGSGAGESTAAPGQVAAASAEQAEVRTAEIPAVLRPPAAQAGQLAAATDFHHCLVNWSGAMQVYLAPWADAARQCDTRQAGGK